MSDDQNGPSENSADRIEPASGKLGVMMPGMGAVATTFVAGVEAVRKGLAEPIGSVTQMATIRLGKRTEGRSPRIKDFVPLADLDDLVFTGWDIFPDDMYTAACKAGVLDRELIEQIRVIAKAIPGVDDIDKCHVRKMGYQFFVDIHVVVDPQMTVENSHRIGHDVKDKLREQVPSVRDVLVHIEPLKAATQRKNA